MTARPARQTIGFGFDPEESPYHFAVVIPRGERELVRIEERFVWGEGEAAEEEGRESVVWRKLGPEERLYLKGIEVESHGEYREGVYQEFARGYGVGEYRSLLAGSGANATRLKTPSEFKNRNREPGGRGFAGSLLRHVLYAVHMVARGEEPPPARFYLSETLTPLGYWDNRQTILALLDYLARRPSPAMDHWRPDVEAARLLAGYIQNDSL